MLKRVYHSAFSLIELLVVLAVLVILASLLIPKLVGSSHKKEIIACAGNLKKLGAAFHVYVLENKGYAPFNPDSNDYNGDKFYSWEALYLLGPYLDDPDHKKFEAGTWSTVRCPGNRCNYYRTGNAVDQFGSPYSSNWNNRQAPKKWPSSKWIETYPQFPYSYTVVAHSTENCSPGEQIVDYQYNFSLGGSFRRLTYEFGPFGEWYKNHPKNYKLDFILQFPSEAVIFCDIQHANVLHENQSFPGKDKFVYGYPTFDPSWGNGNNGAGAMRTNERIHNGKGINAVFVDGHVEFLPDAVAYNGLGKKIVNDDLLNWGISYPISTLYKADGSRNSRSNQIPGIHGFRRKQNQSDTYNFSWCIEHEYKKGLAENDFTGEKIPGDLTWNDNWGGVDKGGMCFFDGGGC